MGAELRPRSVPPGLIESTRRSSPPGPIAYEASRSGVEGLDEDIEQTVSGILRGRSPAYTRALTFLHAIIHGPEKVDDVVDGLQRVWGPRAFHVYFERPLLILAALRAEALASANHPLSRGFATDIPDPLAVTRSALIEALSPARAGVWCALATRIPQTNEVSRAVAWKWPAALAGCGHRARALGLVDVGTGGGLNLIADRLPDEWEDATGAPLRVATDLNVCMRIGFDLRPLDFNLDADVAWARACLWPGNTHRAARFDRAVAEWRTSATLTSPPTLHALTAALVPTRLPALLAKIPADGLLLVFQTTVRDYMEKSKRGRYEEGMRHWLAGTPAGRVLWIEAEPTSLVGTAASFAIIAHVPDGSGGLRSATLARTTDHPTIVDVDRQTADEFMQYFNRRSRTT
jgi:hypothetical protein